jgi:hypothetical protein
MNRDILFRAKRTDNGEWVEGALFDGENYCVIGQWIKFSPYIENECKIVGYKVDRDTVCEYTGLKDDSGNKIFENDILRLRNEHMNCTWIARVTYGQPLGEHTLGWHFAPLTQHDGITDVLRWCKIPYTTCEVVGNIIDDWNSKETAEHFIAKMKEV